MTPWQADKLWLLAFWTVFLFFGIAAIGSTEHWQVIVCSVIATVGAIATVANFLD